MSKISSAETPTSPIAPIFNQNSHQQQQQQQQLQQYTTKAIVVGSGTQKTKQPPPPPPPRSSTSNTSMSFNVTAADATMNYNTTCANVTVNKAHATLTPSASTSSSASSASVASALGSGSASSASISACTSAAVHHHQNSHQNHSNNSQQQQQYQQQHQQQQHNLKNHQNPSHNNHQTYKQLHHENIASNTENNVCNVGSGGIGVVGRPSTSMSVLPCAVSVSISAAATPKTIKRHTDIVCSSSSSSSSCCSSSGSISGTCGAQTNAVTPTVVNSGPLITQKMSRTPSDKINLRLILVSGKTKEFLFNPSDSAGDIAQTVFDNWPEDWEREAVSKAEILRLIYQGRFLHCNVTLGALGLPLGKTTVMHLVPRDNLPEPNSQDQRQKSKGGSSRCCSTTCCIL